MKFHTFIDPKEVFVNEEADSIETAVRKILQKVTPADLKPTTADAILQQVLERERTASTYVGNGVAVPHARVQGLVNFLVYPALFKKGFKVSGQEGRVQTLFLILCPAEQTTRMLGVLSGIAKIAQDPVLVERLAFCADAEEFIDVLRQEGPEVGRRLIARDIMTQEYVPVHKDMTLKELAAVFFRNKVDTAPVVGNDGTLLGEITGRELLGVGIPAEMHNPMGTSEDVELFQDFFRQENTLTAGEILNKTIIRVSPETPLENIAFAIYSGSKHRVYVVENKKLVGIIYRLTVINRVLFV